MLGVENTAALRRQKGVVCLSSCNTSSRPLLLLRRRTIMKNNATLFTVAWDAWRAERGGASALARCQHRRLADLVDFARAHSPWYQQRYSQLPATITERSQLPPVTKPELIDWKSTRLNSSHIPLSRMPSSA